MQLCIFYRVNTTAYGSDPLVEKWRFADSSVGDYAGSLAGSLYEGLDYGGTQQSYVILGEERSIKWGQLKSMGILVMAGLLKNKTPL